MRLDSENTNRHSTMADLLKISSKLSQAEVEDFGRDLGDIRDETNRAEVRVTVSRKLDVIYGKEDASVDPILGRIQSRSLPKDEW